MSAIRGSLCLPSGEPLPPRVFDGRIRAAFSPSATGRTEQTIGPMSSPLVSVVLPVYNGADTLGLAIDDILGQSFGDFELIVLDDGSRDDPAAVVAARPDPRIRFVSHPNRGLAATLNRGIELARGSLIARQDHDDRSLPLRLEKQVALFAADPTLTVAGTHAAIWTEAGPTKRSHTPVWTSGAVRFETHFASPFVHTSVMMRREAVIAAGLYATERERQPEDYDLWSRMARLGRMANVPEPLTIYTERAGSITQTESFDERVDRISTNNIALSAGLSVDDPDVVAIVRFARRRVPDRGAAWSTKRMSEILRGIAERLDAAEGTRDASERAAWWIARIERRARRHRIKSLFGRLLGRG